MDNDVKFADHNAIATFPDLPAAREAIGALEDRALMVHTSPCWAARARRRSKTPTPLGATSG